MEEAGWEVLHEDTIPGKLEDLRSIQIDHGFDSYDVNDLLILESWIVAKRRDVSPAVRGRMESREVTRDENSAG